MEVSVIIPVRNDRQRLKRLLDCLQRQVLPGSLKLAEVIVVDNGSVDGSFEVAVQHANNALAFPGLRVGALRNRAAQVARGEIFAFADSDHEVPEDWLAKGCDVLLSDGSVVAAGSHYLAPSEGTWVQRVWAIHRLRGDSPRDVHWLGSGNLFVRRVDFESVGGFDEKLVAAEDVDLCFRLRQLGRRVVLDKRIRSIHHGEPKTLLHFVKKEYWRGSSGIRAWVSQGFPLRDLPSLIWPAWHLVLGIAAILLGIVLIVAPSVWIGRTLALVLFAWLAPSALLALRTAQQTKSWKSLCELWLLYFAYGIARAAALFRS